MRGRRARMKNDKKFQEYLNVQHNEPKQSTIMRITAQCETPICGQKLVQAEKCSYYNMATCSYHCIDMDSHDQQLEWNDKKIDEMYEEYKEHQIDLTSSSEQYEGGGR